MYLVHPFTLGIGFAQHASHIGTPSIVVWLRHYLGKGWFDYKRKHKAKQHPSDYIFSKADEASAAGIREQTQH